MRTAVRLTSIFSIFVSAAASSAFAQPAKPGPDGWTTGSGGSTAIPGAGGSLSLQPAGTSAAAPAQPALGPPGTVPSTPAVTGGGGSDTDEPNGPFLAGSLGVGSAFAMADLQLGWRIGARVSPFVSLGGAVVLEDDDGGGAVSLIGVGARLWFDKVFMEARVTRATTAASCDFNEPCTDHTTYLPILGIGGVVGGRHVGLEARAVMITGGHDAVFLGTLGIGFYP